MNEFDLIKRYLEKSGSYKMVGAEYYNEGLELNAAGAVDIGNVAGIGDTFAFFFGNITINIQLSGVIAAADANELETYLRTNLPRGAEPGVTLCHMAVGAGINPMGDGRYIGHRRLYGVGFNQLELILTDIGAANVEYNFNVNGYLFRLR